MSTEEVEGQPAHAIEVGQAVMRPSPPRSADSTVQDEHAQEPLTKSGVAIAGERAVMVSVRLPGARDYSANTNRQAQSTEKVR